MAGSRPRQGLKKCPGSGEHPGRVLRVAERVLLADTMTVHRGGALCAVCGRHVGLNLSGVVTAHVRGIRESSDDKKTGT
jgi:hypothetical protein